MKEIEEKYKLLVAIFGVNYSVWDMIHTKYTPSMFCIENRKSIIAEYLIWKEFVKDAKAMNFTYYCGIDSFLEAYKTAVYSCLKNVD